ncbi:paraquat-inducible protein A [Sneathiella limimaris]|uniref:paraquat-inducible protein A n=1 Tax=Sneathiella limimaris TaxID=1964213 RepID=UPI00146BDE26|nr:paraquat-inducible protein A [Sneathiella limimaris]
MDLERLQPIELKSKLILCPECDLIHQASKIDREHSAICARCGAVLYRERGYHVDRSLAFAIAGLVSFFVANSFPILRFHMQGNEQVNILIDGVIRFMQTDYWPLGVLVLFVSVVAPFLILSFLVSLLLPLRIGLVPKFARWQVRSLILLKPWAMAEILIVGIMVAYVKLGDFAIVDVGVSLGGIVAMVLATVLAFANLDFQVLWSRLEEIERS